MVTPNNKKLQLKENDLIVSKTDVKGHITYCNDTFMEFSGYYEEELIGQPHNIIRHPDMPRAVFRFMWQTLQQENEFFGFVKNLSKMVIFTGSLLTSLPALMLTVNYKVTSLFVVTRYLKELVFSKIYTYRCVKLKPTRITAKMPWMPQQIF